MQTSELFGQLLLPPWAKELRPHQEEAIDQIMDLFESRKVVFLDAPTGAGKTLIGEAVRQLVRQRWQAKHGLYLCTTKSLQAQFLHDFPYARLIKGRANYPTLDEPKRFDVKGARRLTAGMCTKKGIPMAEGDSYCSECEFEVPDLKYTTESGMDKKGDMILHCMSCHPWQHCPYEVAKNDALNARLAVANTAYFLTEANYVGRFGADKDDKSKFELVIIDEADTLENVLMGFVELHLPKRAMKAFGLEVPQYKTKPETWVTWAQKAKDVIQVEAKRIAGEMAEFDVPPPTLAAENDRVHRYMNQLESVAVSIALEPDNWVLDGYKKGDVHLKPIMVTNQTRPLLWRHSKRFLLMSATIVSARQMATDLGLGEHEWASVEVDSHFPVNRRPIRVQPVASMTFKTKDTAWPKMAKGVEEVLDRHISDRVLVHTVSYPLTKFLETELKKTDHADRILSYDSPQQRDGVLQTYRNQFASVILAPSFDRGIDLPDDDCRVIIVAKVPFPSLGDKQVSQRFFGTHTGKGWFYTETIRSLVQMSGRGMRHREDFVETYILDAQFSSNIWTSKYKRLIPQWWSDALVWEGPLRISRH